jgi:hypothetical protein
MVPIDPTDAIDPIDPTEAMQPIDPMDPTDAMLNADATLASEVSVRARGSPPRGQART